MSDFRLKVVAETQEAQKQLREVDDSANKATKTRNIKIEIPNYSDLSKNFRDLNKDVSSAANGIKEFYKVASKLPVGPVKDINELAGSLKRVAVTATESGRNVGDAGDVIKATFNATNKAAETLVARLTKIALGLYVIKEAAGLVQGAFSGLFNETIGREIKLRETILKTQTTLASTNKVFKDGKEIIDPYQKIVTLTGAVRKNIDSIRERSIALAGVTSGEVIEVFGMVASQVGQIGGGLKEAEDLAINFAAALGTFGIPLYQARQEIGSILRGDITTDSYLAKALGIRNEDIAKAKTETGGVVKFLEERLAAAVAGQRIAAEGFSGVVSNIKDLSELVSQNFGAGLLDPLLDSLTSVFNFLFSIREELFAIAKLAGQTIGTIADTAIKLVGGATGGVSAPKEDKGQATSKFGADDALNAAKATVNYVKVEVSKAFSTVYLQISTLLERVSSAFLAVGGGLAMLAKGLLSIKLEQLKALIGAIEAISPALLVVSKGLGAFLGMWGKFMELPLVQELAQISAGMRALEVTGVMPVIRAGFILYSVITSWGKIIGFVTTQFNALRAIIGGVIAWLGQLIAQAGRTGVALLTAWTPASKALQALREELLSTISQLEAVGTSAERAGGKIGGFQVNVDKAKGGLVGLIAGMIKFQLIMFAISAILSGAMERFSDYKEQQDKIASDKRAQEAIRRLATTYKNLGENATEAQKRAKAFEQSLVNQKYDEAVAGLEKVRKKIVELREELKPGIQSFGEFLLSLSQTEGQRKALLEGELKNELAKEKTALDELAKYEREVNKIAAEDNIKLIAQKQADLSKEYAELQRQQQNDLFQQRQTLARKEVEIFQAAGELRIRQMERANAKLIEGEEGASRTALEALNNYLSVRENGELEIEAAKKDVVIEVANLEKTIADYRFENEKKIAEIRKRAGQNDMAMADALRQAEGQGPRLTGGGAFNTGLRTGPAPVIGGSEDYHQDLSFGPGVDLRQQRELMVQLAQAYDALGRKIVLSNAGVAGKEFPLSGTAQQQNEFILNAQAAHRNRPGGGRTAIDFYAPTKTDPKGRFGSSVVNQPMLAPTVEGGKTNYFAGGAGGAGVELTKDGASILKLIHGRTDIPLPSGGNVPGASTASAAAATPTPALQSLDLGAPGIEAVTASMQKLSSAFERQRQLVEELTNAKTVEAFENIAKSVFQPVELEQYQDQLYEVQLTYDAVAASSADAFNPERAKIAVEQATKIAASNRELGQIIEGINARSNISESKKKTLIEQVTARQKAFVASLKDEELARYRIQAVSNVTQVLQQIKQQTAAIYDQIEADKLRNSLEAEGVSTARVSAELAKLALRKELNKAQEELTDLLEKEKKKRDEIAALLPGAKDAERTRIQAELDAALARIKELEQKQTDLPKAGATAAAAIDAQAVPKTPAQIVQDRIGQLKREAAELTNVGNMTVKVADSIGSAFSNSFKGIIDGSMTARQALGSFFQGVADMFLEMAAQMIAKMIMLAFLNSIVGILPGFAGGGGLMGGAFSPGAGFNPGTGGNIGSWGSGGFLPNANGNAFAQNGIQPFARGGIVDSPTFFKFAKGGSMANGVMGEAGPEAILPLKRGANGKLGVQVVPFAKGGVFDDMRRKAAVTSALFGRGGSRSGSGGGSPQASGGGAAGSVVSGISSNFGSIIGAVIGGALQQPKKFAKGGVFEDMRRKAALMRVLFGNSGRGGGGTQASGGGAAGNVIGGVSSSFSSILGAVIRGALGQPKKYAKGGIVDRPTLFPFAKGGAFQTGLMGEAGPEAIVPLSRGPGGKLGISGGGGSITVNVSVDASGSKVQGDSGKGEQLGRAVSQAVQEELLRQKRPGGLLAG